tara:strand:- start:49 stop:288 length:240 start_codon:yes stop_codon:yes gene_type:complete
MERNYKTYKITVKSIIEQTFEHWCYSKNNAKIMHEMHDYPKLDKDEAVEIITHVENHLLNTKVLKTFKPKIQKERKNNG